MAAHYLISLRRLRGARAFLRCVPRVSPWAILGASLREARRPSPGATRGRGEKVGGPAKERQLQVLRLTTPKLENVWGPVRSG
jgi:hypothetical protein